MRNKVKKIQYVTAFLEDVQSIKTKIIRLNLERNVNGGTHTEYNDVSNEIMEKWKKTLFKLKKDVE